MKITDVEAVVLRQPVLDDGIADGSQDDLVILVHTDEGITGIGEVDSAPGGRPRARPGARLARDREQPPRPARRRGPARPGAALAEDVPRPDLHRPPRDRAARDQRHRHRALGHRRQGSGQARLRADRHAAARQGARVRLDADARRPGEVVRSASASCATTASPRSSSAGARSARTPTTTSSSRRPRSRRAAATVTILIDAGHGYVDDAKPAIERRARARGARRLLARGAVPARRVRGLRRARRHGRHPRRRGRAGHDALGLPRADRARQGRPDPARRDALRRDHRDAADRRARARAGVETVPHAWKSGIIKAASLHVNAVLPGRALPGVLHRRHADQPDAHARSGCRSTATGSSPCRPGPASASRSTRTSWRSYRVD